ncbi:hypothetical protein KSP40_PGU002428 [Platanthera guangdongensis]|uniref:Uncharacterized protein n=1 Tax=Platanthera guangdongensis TaxID=2320717 RepID=A0ABR2MK40_9ASPA
MEAHLLERVNLHLENLSLTCFDALASAGALLANPKSSDSTRRAVVESLSRLVFLGNADCPFLRCAVKLLGGLAAQHSALAPSILQLLVPLLTGNKALAVDVLASLSSIDGFLLDYNLLLLLASSPVVSLRSMAVRLLVSSLDGDKPITVVMNSHSMIQVLLGLADDIYPLIRANAVDGLASLCRQTRFGVSLQIAKCLYDCAASLLHNENELVKLSAIRLISSCGEVLERNKADTCYRELMDAIFLQLCVMARDMNMKVRVEAFSSLQKVQGVSETMLLQSLSKKILGTQSIQNPLIEHNLRNFKFPFSSSAGAFVHGIEDEFHEVRLAACKSLGTLTILSVQFAAAAMDLLMDLLNDDAIVIRLQCLEALYQMATNDQLVILKKHMDMVRSRSL